MPDNRELILAQLVTIAEGIAGVKTIARNKGSISDVARPAIIILDASELAVENDPESRIPSSVRRVRMVPEIYILMSGPSEDVGPDINAFRALLIKAIMTDSALAELSLNGRGIRYEGCSLELALGRAMEGALSVSFSFTYVLEATKL